MTNENLIVKHCNTDNLFYVYLNNEEIGHQQSKPTNDDLLDMYLSNQWQNVFNQMKSGERVRVSDRIYWDMLGAVPPKKQTETSFYCGECYSGNLYYYFETIDGKRYGQLKPLN